MDTGVIHKLHTLRFCNFRFPLSYCTYTKAFSLHPTSPLVRAYGYYFLEKIWETYHSYQSKNHKQHYKIKKLLCKTIGKCRIKTLRRALGIKLVKSAISAKITLLKISHSVEHWFDWWRYYFTVLSKFPGEKSYFFEGSSRCYCFIFYSPKAFKDFIALTLIACLYWFPCSTLEMIIFSPSRQRN